MCNPIHCRNHSPATALSVCSLLCPAAQYPDDPEAFEEALDQLLDDPDFLDAVADELLYQVGTVTAQCFFT